MTTFEGRGKHRRPDPTLADVFSGRYTLPTYQVVLIVLTILSLVLAIRLMV